MRKKTYSAPMARIFQVSTRRGFLISGSTNVSIQKGQDDEDWEEMYN